MAPAAEYGGQYSHFNPEYKKEMIVYDSFPPLHNQSYFTNSQEGKLDSFTISVTNSHSNVSISVQTPTSKRPLENYQNQSISVNPESQNAFGNYKSEPRTQVPVTHQLHNNYNTPQNTHTAPVSLFAELSAATGGDPFGGPITHQQRSSPASLAVSIEAVANHKVSIANNSSVPLGITTSPNTQNFQHTSAAKVPSEKKSINSLPREPSQSPSQLTQSTSVYDPISGSSNGKYADTNRRLSTATSATFVTSPNTTLQSINPNSPTILDSSTPSSPNTVVNVNVSHSRASSSNGKSGSSANARVNASSVTETKSKRSSGNATTPINNKRNSGSNQPKASSPKATSPNRQHFPSQQNNASNASDKKQPRAKSVKPNKLPLTPEACLFGYKDLLTSYEHREIFDFPDVYYLGAPGVNKVGTPTRRVGGIEKSSSSKEPEVFNHGYDDSRGDYYLTPRDHVGYRYEIVSLLGKGSFGQVVKCFDHKEKRHVALKIIRNKKRFEKQGTVEVKVLDKMRTVDAERKYHSVHMLDHFYFRGHLCITFEMLGINLYEWLKAGGFRGVHLGVIRTFAIQILKCLEVMQQHKIIHCDLKPENVLLCDMLAHQPSYRDSNHPAAYQRSEYGKSSPTTQNYYGPPGFDPTSSQYEIKVIDFGSSCFESEKIYTYVQSRFYRSPEVILGMSYTIAIDMWSFGAILAELFTGYPIFPGENEQEQLACIMEVRGIPELELLERGSRMKLFFDTSGNPRIVANSKGKKRRPGAKSLASVLRCHDPTFLNFLECCLTWDPEKRITPSEALLHDWITGANDPPPPALRSTISSRNSLNASPTAASSRGSRLSGGSSTSSPVTANSGNKKTGEASGSTKNNSLGRSKLGKTATKSASTNSSHVGHQKALSGPISDNKIPTKENDGPSKPRSSSLGSAKSKPTTISYMGAALNQASQFTAGVVKTIKGTAGRISSGAVSAKTPIETNSESKNASPTGLAHAESSESLSNFKVPKTSISQPSSPNARLPPVFPQQSPANSVASNYQYQSYSQNNNYTPSSLSSSPSIPNLNSKRNTLLTTNIPITIKGGGIINIHNPDGTTTTYLPGQQLPSVNILPAGSAASKRGSNYGTPMSSASRASAIYNSSTAPPESPSDTTLPEIKRSSSIVRDSPHGPSPKLTNSAKRSSQGLSHFGELNGKEVKRKSTDNKLTERSDTIGRRAMQNSGKRASGWFA